MSGDWALQTLETGERMRLQQKEAEKWSMSEKEAKRGSGVLEAPWLTCFKKEGAHQCKVSLLPPH